MPGSAGPGVVAPIPAVEFEGRVAPNIAAAVLVSVMRDEFDGPVPTAGSFTDPESGFIYRVIKSEDLPQRPHVEFTCEASKLP
jgi:hypothetical protein